EKKFSISTVVWELASNKKWKLTDGQAQVSFAPDGKTVAVVDNDYRSTKSSLRLLELASGKELAKLDCPEKERYFSAGSFSPDGVLLPVHLGGKKGAPVEVWFLDAKTLENRDKLIGTGDPDGRGFSTGVFTRDGKRFVILDGIGNILLWNVAGRKLERTLPTGSHRPSWQLTFS